MPLLLQAPVKNPYVLGTNGINLAIKPEIRAASFFLSD